MGGVFLDLPPTGDRLAPVRAKIANAKVVCSTVPEIAGNRDIAAVRAPQDVVAIVRVDFGVAETGSVLLSDRELRVNALAYLAQHLIVLLDPADILVNLHHAYRRPEFRNGHYAAFHAGPSANLETSFRRCSAPKRRSLVHRRAATEHFLWCSRAEA